MGINKGFYVRCLLCEQTGKVLAKDQTTELSLQKKVLMHILNPDLSPVIDPSSGKERMIIKDIYSLRLIGFID